VQTISTWESPWCGVPSIPDPGLDFEYRKLSANVVGYFRGETLDMSLTTGSARGSSGTTATRNRRHLNYALPHGYGYGNLRNALDSAMRDYGYPSPLVNSSPASVQSAEGAIMSDVSEPFDQPRMAINCVYTKRGDTGETSLAADSACPRTRRESRPMHH